MKDAHNNELSAKRVGSKLIQFQSLLGQGGNFWRGESSCWCLCWLQPSQTTLTSLVWLSKQGKTGTNRAKPFAGPQNLWSRAKWEETMPNVGPYVKQLLRSLSAGAVNWQQVCWSPWLQCLLMQYLQMVKNVNIYFSSMKQQILDKIVNSSWQCVIHRQRSCIIFQG